MDKCLNLSVIPQFGGTCWLNAILTIALYSQNTREVVLKQAKKWDKNNKFLMIIKSILIKYYNEPKEVQKFFNKIRPEIILFKMLKTFNNYDIIHNIKQQLKRDKNMLGWFENYIIMFFKYLNINCLDIIYSNGKYILNFDNELNLNTVNGIINHSLKNPHEDPKVADKRVYENTKKILKKIPDIIIVAHNQLNGIVDYTYMKEFNTHKSNSKVFYPETYKCEIKGIDTYEDVIYVNGHKYILDAVLLVNYDIATINIAHVIAGITCNKNRYVYNGWQSNTTDPAFQAALLQGNESSPCSLMPFNWDLKKDNDFCLNLKACNLDFFDKAHVKPQLCFSFGTSNNIGRRLLIYVRADIEKTDEKKISIPSRINISNISGLVRDMHDIKGLNEYELMIELNTLGINLLPNYHYPKEVLEALYFDALKKHYNVHSSDIIQQRKKEKSSTKEELMKKKLDKSPNLKTKEELIKKVLIKYPDLKNVKTKTKEELKEILIKGPVVKEISKDKTKEELIKIVMKKIQKLTKSKLEKLINVL